MFGRKKKKETQKETAQTAEARENVDLPKDGRVHSESLGHVWIALTGINPSVLIPQVVGTVLHEGGTRPPWKWREKDREFVLMAWPQDQPIRAAVLMGGPPEGELKPITCVPLLEGLPNDLTVEAVHERMEGHGGDVAVAMIENKNPMWFYDALLGRDRIELTPGVTHTFWLAGLALGFRKALLDEVTITNGPQFEAWAQVWLADHPGAGSKDVPPLKLDLKGKPFIMPGRFFGEYQIRAIIDDVQDTHLEKMPVKILYFNFPFENRPDMRLPVYVSQYVYGDAELEKGMEIEAYIWLQGRIIDLEAPGSGADA